MSEIVPVILTKDPVDLHEKLDLLTGICPRIQIDVVDGVFAATRTLGLEAMVDLESDFRLDLHLMVKNPFDWVEKCRRVVADRVIAQVEMMPDIEIFLTEVANSGMEIGLALDLETAVTKVPAEIYARLDLVLLMAVKAGLGGQKFDQRVINKIKEVKEIVGDLVQIAVDGGLDDQNLKTCQEAGASTFYLNTSFWEAGNLGKRYRDLLNLVK